MEFKLGLTDCRLVDVADQNERNFQPRRLTKYRDDQDKFFWNPSAAWLGFQGSHSPRSRKVYLKIV